MTKVYKCRECGTDTDWTEELVLAFSEKAVVCDQCCEDYQNSKKPVVYKEFIQDPIESIIKPLYMQTNINKLPELAQSHFRSVQNWQQSSRKGLDFLGHPRQGKTRVMTLLMRMLHNDGVAMKIFYAGDFQAELLTAKKSNWYNSWRNRILNIPLLAIDDLFSEKLTESVEKALFELIEQRMANQLPVFITRQLDKKSAIDLFSDKLRGHSFFERLKETTTKYVFNQENLEL